MRKVHTSQLVRLQCSFPWRLVSYSMIDHNVNFKLRIIIYWFAISILWNEELFTNVLPSLAVHISVFTLICLQVSSSLHFLLFWLEKWSSERYHAHLKIAVPGGVLSPSFFILFSLSVSWYASSSKDAIAKKRERWERGSRGKRSDEEDGGRKRENVSEEEASLGGWRIFKLKIQFWFGSEGTSNHRTVPCAPLLFFSPHLCSSHACHRSNITLHKNLLGLRSGQCPAKRWLWTTVRVKLSESWF